DATAPMFCVVSVTMNVVPRCFVAGGADTTVSTRSGRVTVTAAVGDAAQLLPSSLSVARARSSAQAMRRYVFSGVVAGIVTLATSEWTAPPARPDVPASPARWPSHVVRYGRPAVRAILAHPAIALGPGPPASSPPALGPYP